jgi:hypothetical protein
VLTPLHSKRWRVGPASPNVANQLGLRRQSIAATALLLGARLCRRPAAAGSQIRAASFSTRHSLPRAATGPADTVALRQICVTTSLTCFLSPRRGHSFSRRLFAQCASCQLCRTKFHETGERFTFSSGEKAGMRASVKPLSCEPPYSKRWRAGPASSNFANHLGLGRKASRRRRFRLARTVPH